MVWPYVDAILRLHESVDSFVAWLEYHVAAAPPAFIFPQPFKFQGIALAPSLVQETQSVATVVWIEGDYVLNYEASDPSSTRRSRVAQFEIVRTGDHIKVNASCLERLLSVWFLALLGEIAKDYPEATTGLSEYVRTRSGRVPGSAGEHLLAELLKLGEEDHAEAVLAYVGAKPVIESKNHSQNARETVVVPVMKYLDFELEIQSGSGRDYPVSVLRSPAGEARATMRFPFDQIALESRLKDLQIALLRSGGARRTIPSAEEKTVQEFGGALFEAAFGGLIGQCYAVSRERAASEERGLRVKLRIQTPELAALPWEYLYDAQRAEYVCLSTLTPLVRYLELPQPTPALRVVPPLRILGLVANPSDQAALDVEREKERVERAVAPLRDAGKVEITWLEGQSWRDLQTAMRGGPWHIFHFVGHGGFDVQADEGLIVLRSPDGCSQFMRASQIGRLLADHSSLRLVLLNACEGARGGVRDVFSGTAATLVRRGIPVVLAMQYEITDRAAIEFAHGFYEALADGLPVDAAVAEARKAVSLEIANTVEWGTPALYMRAPDGVLFTVERQIRQPSTEKMGRIADSFELLTPTGLPNIDLRRDVTEIAVCRTTPSVLYALFDNSLFVSRDSARSWSSTTAGADLIAADPDHAAVIYALRTTGLFVSHDFGETWDLRSEAIRFLSIGGGRFTIHPEDNQRMVYSTMKGVYVSSNQGRTWRNCFPGWQSSGASHWHYAIDNRRPGGVVAVYFGRGVYLSADWGETWNEINPPPTGAKPRPGLIQPLAIESQTSSIWYADLGVPAGPRGLFVTHNRGESWEQNAMGGPPNESLVDYIELVQNQGQTTIYTAYPGGTTHYSQNGGHDWVPVSVDWCGLPNDFGQAEGRAVLLAPIDALTNDGRLYLKTQRGLLKSSDNGRTWHR